MISDEKLQELKEQLETSQNPLFFFDNDVDGLCAFLILRRALDRGRGIPIKSYPDLNSQYLRKIDELNPDAVIILDKAEVSKDFIEGAIEKNTKVIWIDHHKTDTPKEIIEKTYYYNSLPEAEPTTYIAHSVWKRKNDEWIALTGCTGDVYKPDFADSFAEDYPEIFNSNIPTFDALHSTEIGKISRMLNFGLMDTTTNVVKLLKYLFTCNSPYDLLEENQYTKDFHKRYRELNEFYQTQIKKAEAESNKDSPTIIFTYSGKTSMSSQIANGIYYKNQDKLIIVGFKREEKVNISIRGKRALEITKRALEDIPDSTGGGHAEATGAMVPIDSWEKFRSNILELTK